MIEIGSDKYTEPNHPYWLDSTSRPQYPGLDEDIEVDVAIVGGGMVGITCAYLLGREDLTTAIIEADRILHGTTGHTTAKITSQHSLIYASIKKKMGEEKAGQYAQANETAIRTIRDIVKENDIQCDFMEMPAHVYTQSDKYIQDIEDEVRAACSLGIKAEFTEELHLPFPVKAAVRFHNQAQFHPLKYLDVLTQKATDSGTRIFEQTRAMNIEREGEDKYLVVTHSGHKVRAGQVIIATHFPFYDGGGYYFARIYVSRSYALGVTMEDKLPWGMYISAEDPVRSLRTQPYQDGELVLVGGEGHKTGQADDTSQHYSNLVKWARETFRVTAIPYQWSTQDCMTLDYIPYVGRLTRAEPGLYVATGFNKWGMTNSTASAIILRDLIVKGENPWTEVYDPSRFPALGELVVQNADVAKHYVAGKISIKSGETEVAAGEARVIKWQGEKTGAYRDEDDQLHLMDITCTHMGCELGWNNAERTWDCPCHGSRFAPDGAIVEGPALNYLKPVEESRNDVEPNVLQ
ncbi:MAG: FAD-dependent oxidoreductase [Syntrophomonadaceae bacterium]